MPYAPGFKTQTGKNPRSSRKIRRSDGKLYASITVAARKNGLSHTAVWQMCAGTQKFTSFRYAFRYEDGCGPRKQKAPVEYKPPEPSIMATRPVWDDEPPSEQLRDLAKDILELHKLNVIDNHLFHHLVINAKLCLGATS